MGSRPTVSTSEDVTHTRPVHKSPCAPLILTNELQVLFTDDRLPRPLCTLPAARDTPGEALGLLDLRRVNKNAFPVPMSV